MKDTELKSGDPTLSSDKTFADILNSISKKLVEYANLFSTLPKSVRQSVGALDQRTPLRKELVELIMRLSECTPHDNLTVKCCTGKGRCPAAHSFWLGFLPHGQKAGDGIYTAICFEEGGERICVGCCKSGRGGPQIPSSILEVYPQGLSSKGKININENYYNNYFTNETEVFLRGKAGWTTDDAMRIRDQIKKSENVAMEILERLEKEHVGSSDKTNNAKATKIRSNHPLNQILYGPPGTGKTRNAVIRAVEIADGHVSTDEYNKVLKRFNELKEAKRIEFTTFHQSYGYEDFIEGIQPKLEGDDLRYELRDGIFKRFCNVARNAPKDNYVFIIDEINRGNIAKIFGELITLIEPSRRAGAEEEMTAVLPYSQKSFSVPNNVYVLGTMNTADRSIALLDTALRRRFSFVEMMPETEVLNDNVDGIDLKRLLATINRRITFLLDREHQIGHSYFINIDSKDKLAEVFRSNVIPLLQEYFFDDYEKIQLVIGTAFVKEIPEDENLFNLLENSNAEKKVFVLDENAFKNPESYTAIHKHT